MSTSPTSPIAFSSTRPPVYFRDLPRDVISRGLNADENTSLVPISQLIALSIPLPEDSGLDELNPLDNDSQNLQDSRQKHQSSGIASRRGADCELSGVVNLSRGRSSVKTRSLSSTITNFPVSHK